MKVIDDTIDSYFRKFESPDVADEADTGIVMEGHHSKTKNLISSIFRDNFGVPVPEETTHTQMAFVPNDIVQCFSYLCM